MPASDQGASQSRYTLIPRTLVFLTCGERVLLLKGASHKRLWPGRYNGVGGHIEHGEDILSAARRELLEETGLSPTDLWLCGIITIDTGQNPGIGVFVLRGECSAVELRPSEEGIPEWVSIVDINDLPLVEDLFSLLPRVLAMRHGDPLFTAQYRYDAQGQLIIQYGS